MTEMFGEAWPPMSVPDLAPDDDDDDDDDDIACPQQNDPRHVCPADCGEKAQKDETQNAFNVGSAYITIRNNLKG